MKTMAAQTIGRLSFINTGLQAGGRKGEPEAVSTASQPQPRNQRRILRAIGGEHSKISALGDKLIAAAHKISDDRPDDPASARFRH
jgi:hypothetical protein